VTLEPEFREGDSVRVVVGPFRSFVGVVSGAGPDASRIRVSLPVFGHETILEFDRLQLERVR
jgi:transcriptional antiterminator NusG